MHKLLVVHENLKILRKVRENVRGRTTVRLWLLDTLGLVSGVTGQFKAKSWVARQIRVLYALPCWKKLKNIWQGILVNCIKKSWFFSKKIGNSFNEVLENVTISNFVYFLASYCFPYSFLWFCVVYSHMKSTYERTYYGWTKLLSKTWKHSNFGRLMPGHWDIRKSNLVAIFFLIKVRFT